MGYNSIFYESSKYYGKASVAEYRINPGIRAKFDTLFHHLTRKGWTQFLRSLDIGCGGSPFTRLLACAQRIFVDLSFAPLRGLRGENLVQADLAHIPFRQGSFHVMVGTDVIEHLPHDDVAVKELGRIGANKAILILTVPHNPSLWSASDLYEGHFRRYSVERLVKLLVGGGFSIASIFKIYGVYFLMRAAQSRDRKNTQALRFPIRARKSKKTSAEFILSDVVNLLRKLAQNKLFRVLYLPFVLIFSRLIMCDACILPFSKASEIGIVAQIARG